MKPRPSAKQVAQRFLRVAGGTDFYNFVKIPDPKRAFQSIVSEAQHESGHGGYSGTIAEKRDFQIRKQQPMTLEQAREFANTDLDLNDKWGPAFAVPVATPRSQPKTTEETVTVPAINSRKALQVAKAELQKRFPKALITVSRDPKEVKAGKHTFDVQKLEGVKYFTTGVDPFHRLQTLALATQAAKKQLVHGDRGPATTITQHREVSVVTLTAPAESKWQVDAQVSDPGELGPIIGWYFYGIASS